jgi:hypothetical protein
MVTTKVLLLVAVGFKFQVIVKHLHQWMKALASFVGLLLRAVLSIDLSVAEYYTVI